MSEETRRREERVGISGRTGLLVIMADPVAQARAPALVNAALTLRGADAVMVPLHVGAEGLADVVRAWRAMRNLHGAVVSMPHKSTIVPLLDETTTEARQVGACNAIRREHDGRLVGTMFDGEGFVAGLRAGGHEVQGRRVFLAGAGGAAAGIAFALGKHGASGLTIHNRTRAKADALATRVRTTWPTLAVVVGGDDPTDHDVVVNATALGMRSDDPLPLDVAALRPGMLAVEIVIQPRTTAFLAAAASRGCAVHYGEPMLAAQIDLMLDFILSGTSSTTARRRPEAAST